MLSEGKSLCQRKGVQSPTTHKEGPLEGVPLSMTVPAIGVASAWNVETSSEPAVNSRRN